MLASLFIKIKNVMNRTVLQILDCSLACLVDGGLAGSPEHRQCQSQIVLLASIHRSYPWAEVKLVLVVYLGLIRRRGGCYRPRWG